VRLLADDGDVRTVTRLLNRVVLADLGGLVGLLSVMLLGTQGGPSFTGDTSLSSSSATSVCSAPPC
jgi:ubiquinone biosynthesis protein